MLRHAVKSFLEKQNRLSFSSLQVTIRRLQILTICRPHLKNGSAQRTLKHNMCKNFHATGILSCSVNNVNVKGGNKHFNKESSDVENNFIVNDDDHDNVLSTDNKVGSETKLQLFNPETDMESSDIENIYESDSYEDSEEYEDEMFHMEDKRAGKVLVPLQRRELEASKSNRNISLKQLDEFYKPKSIIQTLLDEEKMAGDEINSDYGALVKEYDIDQAEKGVLKTVGVPKVAFPALTSIAPIVNDSEVLKKMVDLGVSLYDVQRKGMIDRFLQMNFTQDVAPYIFFLQDTGVPAEKFGQVFTQCPWIFQHDIHNLKVRVDYLRSKKFSKTSIVNMIDSDPLFLLIPMKRIDAKLGYLQKEFKLSGSEVRKSVSSFPKLIIAKPAVIQDRKFYMKKFLGFKENELKSLLLTFPEVYIRSSERTAQIFDYLHNVMELPHGLIAKTGQSLATARHTLESRHRFLVKLGRAQYNPTLPNYVSLKSLTVMEDEIFCMETAKTSISEFNTFLRLI